MFAGERTQLPAGARPLRGWAGRSYRTTNVRRSKWPLCSRSRILSHGGAIAGSWRVQARVRPAVKGNLQGFSSAGLRTRNEGVRGSNPRVGFLSRGSPCISAIRVVSEGAESTSPGIKGGQGSSQRKPCKRADFCLKGLRHQLPPGAMTHALAGSERVQPSPVRLARKPELGRLQLPWAVTFAARKREGVVDFLRVRCVRLSPSSSPSAVGGDVAGPLPDSGLPVQLRLSTPRVRRTTRT